MGFIRVGLMGISMAFIFACGKKDNIQTQEQAPIYGSCDLSPGLPECWEFNGSSFANGQAQKTCVNGTYSSGPCTTLNRVASCINMPLGNGTGGTTLEQTAINERFYATDPAMAKSIQDVLQKTCAQSGGTYTQP